MMILIMMTSTLAGCTGGDPDSGGNGEIDMSMIEDILENSSISLPILHSKSGFQNSSYTVVADDGDQSSFLNLSINQPENMAIHMEMMRASVNLILEIDSGNYSIYESNWWVAEWEGDLITECTNGYTQNISRYVVDDPYPGSYLPGAGLECTHTFMFSRTIYENYENDGIDITASSWSEWSFSLLWGEHPVITE